MNLLYDKVIDSVHELMQSDPKHYPTVLGGLLEQLKKGGDLKKQVDMMLFINMMDVMYRREERKGGMSGS